MHACVLFLEQGPERPLYSQRPAHCLFYQRTSVFCRRSLHSVHACTHDLGSAAELEKKDCAERNLSCRYLVGVSSLINQQLTHALHSVLITSVIRLVALFSINSDLTCRHRIFPCPSSIAV